MHAFAHLRCCTILLLPLTLAIATCGGKQEPPAEPLPPQAATIDSIDPLKGRSLEPIGSISEESRDYLTRRMREHGNRSTDLQRAVVTMDYVSVARISEMIGKPPATTHFDEGKEVALRQEFPETFFDLEKELQTRARQMHLAARSELHEKVWSEYSAMLSKCVECHRLFTRRTSRDLGSMDSVY